MYFQEDRLLPINFNNPARGNGSLRNYLNYAEVASAVEEPANISGAKRRKNSKVIEGNYNNIEVACLFLN